MMLARPEKRTHGPAGPAAGRVSRPGVYDRRPDPERFTFREVLAHLADWEAVFQRRIEQTLDEDKPALIGLDAGSRSDHDYAHADPAECRARFRQGHADCWRPCAASPAQWERVGTHAEIGPISLEAQAVMITSHDGYHLRPILEWLRP